MGRQAAEDEREDVSSSERESSGKRATLSTQTALIISFSRTIEKADTYS